ncbi:TetR/AcrR family transcriptional regulator [Shouchella patagoniensis]|uniref:TetR/AcrR family transcriptional regulator n=1 Tax=Shouchella patagoniensis TaxID=228576 RepID=UPI0009955217|nr:TetR/AcrR family transcriptional regulator [Shouchella patagoniensis]
MDGFQRRKEMKKGKIIQTSLNLFMAKGVQNVSIAEIARKAKVSQVTIYNYFDSKENLVHEVIIFFFNESFQKAEKVFLSDMPFPDKIRQLIFNKTAVSENIHEDFYLYFMKEYANNTSFIDDYYQRHAIPMLIELFNEGRENGYVDPQVSNEAILFYFHMMKEYMQKEDVNAKILPLTEEIMNILFYGISSKQDR